MFVNVNFKKHIKLFLEVEQLEVFSEIQRFFLREGTIRRGAQKDRIRYQYKNNKISILFNFLI